MRQQAGRNHELPKVFDDGVSHLAFDVMDVEKGVEACAAYAFELVGEIIAIDGGPNKGRKVVYLSNPDGLTIELIGPKPEA